MSPPIMGSCHWQAAKYNHYQYYQILPAQELPATRYYLLKPTKLVSALTRLLSDRPWCHASLERF